MKDGSNTKSHWIIGRHLQAVFGLGSASDLDSCSAWLVHCQVEARERYSCCDCDLLELVGNGRYSLDLAPTR